MLDNPLTSTVQEVSLGGMHEASVGVYILVIDVPVPEVGLQVTLKETIVAAEPSPLTPALAGEVNDTVRIFPVAMLSTAVTPLTGPLGSAVPLVNSPLPQAAPSECATQVR